MIRRQMNVKFASFVIESAPNKYGWDVLTFRRAFALIMPIAEELVRWPIKTRPNNKLYILNMNIALLHREVLASTHYIQQWKPEDSKLQLPRKEAEQLLKEFTTLYRQITTYLVWTRKENQA